MTCVFLCLCLSARGRAPSQPPGLFPVCQAGHQDWRRRTTCAPRFVAYKLVSGSWQALECGAGPAPQVLGRDSCLLICSRTGQPAQSPAPVPSARRWPASTTMCRQTPSSGLGRLRSMLPFPGNTSSGACSCWGSSCSDSEANLLPMSAEAEQAVSVFGHQRPANSSANFPTTDPVVRQGGSLACSNSIEVSLCKQLFKGSSRHKLTTGMLKRPAWCVWTSRPGCALGHITGRFCRHGARS
jgi:hypothetical protein